MNEMLSLTIKTAAEDRAVLSADEKTLEIRYPFRKYTINRADMTDIRCIPYKKRVGRTEYCMIELHIKANGEKFVFGDRLNDTAAINIINGNDPSVPIINMYEFLSEKKLVLPKFAEQDSFEHVYIRIKNISCIPLLLLLIVTAVLIIASNIIADICAVLLMIFILYHNLILTDVYADSSVLLFKGLFAENKITVSDIENISFKANSGKMLSFPTNTVQLAITMKNGRKYRLYDRLDTVGIISDYINSESLKIPLIQLRDFLKKRSNQ